MTTIPNYDGVKNRLVIVDFLGYKAAREAQLTPETKAKTGQMGFTLKAAEAAGRKVHQDDGKKFNELNESLIKPDRGADHESSKDLERTLAEVEKMPIDDDRKKAIRDQLILTDFLTYKLAREKQLSQATKTETGKVGFTLKAVKEPDNEPERRIHQPKLDDKNSSQDLMRVLCELNPEEVGCKPAQPIAAAPPKPVTTSKVALLLRALKIYIYGFEINDYPSAPPAMVTQLKDVISLNILIKTAESEIKDMAILEDLKKEFEEIKSEYVKLVNTFNNSQTRNQVTEDILIKLLERVDALMRKIEESLRGIKRKPVETMPGSPTQTVGGKIK